VSAEVAAADEPFGVLFDHDAGGESEEGAVVGRRYVKARLFVSAMRAR
jgi:hypothetical protein